MDAKVNGLQRPLFMQPVWVISTLPQNRLPVSRTTGYSAPPQD